MHTSNFFYDNYYPPVVSVIHTLATCIFRTKKSMIYGILSIQILEDVQVLTDGVGHGRGNQNRLNRWLWLHDLYP